MMTIKEEEFLSHGVFSVSTFNYKSHTNYIPINLIFLTFNKTQSNTKESQSK